MSETRRCFLQRWKESSLFYASCQRGAVYFWGQYNSALLCLSFDGGGCVVTSFVGSLVTLNALGSTCYLHVVFIGCCHEKPCACPWPCMHLALAFNSLLERLTASRYAVFLCRLGFLAMGARRCAGGFSNNQRTVYDPCSSISPTNLNI